MSINVQSYLKSHAVTATTLCAIVIDAWDADALQWEPEVLSDALVDLAKGPIPQINLDKIHALTAAITTSAFYDDVFTFSYVCNAIGGLDEKVFFSVFDPPTPKEFAWAVCEVNLNNPVSKQSDAFHPDVLTFMGLLLRESGLASPPQALSFVTVPLDNDPELLADDPVIYQAYHSLLQENMQDVDAYVKFRYRQLLAELKHLQLEHSDFDSLMAKLSKRN